MKAQLLLDEQVEDPPAEVLLRLLFLALDELESDHPIHVRGEDGILVDDRHDAIHHLGLSSRGRPPDEGYEKRRHKDESAYRTGT